ncbi:TetR/AcrR family transcriptional regulator [uncultured Shewanella sp.]|uniref:TetR/AcrR family transcriptional regulator n=1 Tax=uncultured Shewanella sp. TaxID=173975 RepID=UPI002601A5E6|nr:TetR/AcrR family transcriptional regulator [uncultured Shewanella sp.]
MGNPQVTRQKILQVAAAEIHGKGFKATSLANILTAANISKGALYHHFTNKQELGIAVMEEIYMPMFSEPWEKAVKHDDPIGAMSHFVRNMPNLVSQEEMEKGCPMTNICSELATAEPEIRDLANTMFQRLTSLIAKAMQKSEVHDKVNPESAALFIFTSTNGISTLIKSSQSREMFIAVTQELSNYIESLRSKQSAIKVKNSDALVFEPVDCKEHLQKLKNWRET